MIRDLLTPDVGATPYVRGVIGIAHAMLGAAAIYVMPGEYAAALRGVIALGYWLLKERGDLRRGGTLWDGIEDTLFVWLGTFYGAAWWPVAVLIAGGGVMASGYARRK